MHKIDVRAHIVQHGGAMGAHGALVGLFLGVAAHVALQALSLAAPGKHFAANGARKRALATVRRRAAGWLLEPGEGF